MVELIREHFIFDKKTIIKKLICFILLSFFIAGYIYVFGSVYDRPKEGEYYVPTVTDTTERIEEGQIVRQTFVSPVDRIRSLWVYFDSTEMEYPALYVVKIYENGELIQTNDFNTSNGSPRNILLTPMSGCMGKEYTLEINLGRTTSSSYVKMMQQRSWSNSVNNVYIDGEEGSSPLAIMINTAPTNQMATYLVIIGMAVILLFIVILLIGKNPVINTFIIICAFGAFISVLNPVGDVPDEKAHMQRAETVAAGMINSTSSTEYESDRILQELFSMGSQQSNTFARFSDAGLYDKCIGYDTETIAAGTAGNYFFIGYIASSMALLIGKAIHLSGMLCVYLARMFNVGYYAIICSVAVALAPGYKKVFSMIACLPNCIFLAASFSPDGTTISMILLSVALWMRLCNAEDKSLSLKNTIVWLVITTLASVTRIAYAFMLLFALFIPRNKFKDRKERAWTIALMILCVAFALTWMTLSGLGGLRTIEGASASGQIAFIAGNIRESIGIVLGTMINEIYTLYSGMFLLGWNTYGISWIGVVLPFVLYSVCEQEHKLPVCDLIPKKKIMIILVCIYTMTYLGMYVSSNVVGRSVITGIQGRYFLEFFAFVPLLLSGVAKDKKKWICNSNMWSIFFICVMVAAITVRNYM